MLDTSSVETDPIVDKCDLLDQELPLRLHREKFKPRAIEKPTEAPHPLIKIFGPILGGLLLLVWRALFPERAEQQADIATPSPPSTHTQKAEEEEEPNTPDTKQQTSHRASHYEPEPIKTTANTHDLRLDVPQNLRIHTAQKELFDWQMNSNIDPLVAQSLELLVQNGHEMAYQVLSHLDMPTLQHIQNAICEVNPSQDSELSLIADEVAQELHLHTRDKGRGR